MYMVDVELLTHTHICIYTCIHACIHTYIKRDTGTEIQKAKRQRQRETENRWKHPFGKGHLEQKTEKAK